MTDLVGSCGELVEDRPQTVRVLFRIVTGAEALSNLFWQRMCWKRAAALDFLEGLEEGSLVAVREEKPAHALLDRLAMAAARACDHGHAADDRLRRCKAERLGPQRWGNESPRACKLQFNRGEGQPADELDTGTEPEAGPPDSRAQRAWGRRR